MAKHSVPRLLRRRTALGLGLACLAFSTLAMLPRSVSAGGEEAPPVDLQQREESLVREACRYLNLSRSQLSVTLSLARQADRRRTLLQQEDEQARRKLDAQAPQNSEAAAAQRQEQTESRVRAFAQQMATQWVRVLTREQIALAVRLSEGRPPSYANADPSLLKGEAGFSGQWAATEVFLSSLSGESEPLLLQGSALEGLALGRSAGIRILRTAPVTDGGVEVGTPILQRFTLESDGQAANGAERHPFPQRILENLDLTELAGYVTPLAHRLFTSPQFAPVLQDALAHGLEPAAPRPAIPAGSPRLARDFRMEQGLRDLTGRGTELEPLGGRLDHGRYVFDAGQGLELRNAGVTDHYAVELLFRYFGGDSYQKILDFKNGTKDDGLYFYQGHLTFYRMADGGQPQPGQEHRLRIDRNRATHIVRGTLDGVQAFAFLDLDDEAVFDKSAGRLFVDDKTTGNEQGPGELRALMVWTSPMRR